MKKYVLLLLALCASAEALRVNEVMYNPLDEGDEFVELSGSLNYTNLTAGDDFRNGTLTLIRNTSSNYSLVVASGFNLTTGNATIYNMKSIGNGLANSGDSFYLYSNGSQLVNFTYKGNDADEGYSLEYYNGNYSESLVVNGTPGSANSRTKANKSNQTINSTENETEVCNVTLALEAEGGVFHESGNALEYRHVVKGTDNFSVEYGVKDLFGAEVREARKTSNDNWKQFTPSPELPVQAYVLWNKMPDPCGNGTLENSQIIVSKGEENACTEEKVCSEFQSEIGKLETKISKLESRPESCSSGGSKEYVVTEDDASIESFYTRKESFDPEINLFSRIEGNGIYELKLTSQIEGYGQKIIPNGSTIDLKVKAERGKNVYVLELKDMEGERKDVEVLVVEFQKDDSLDASTSENDIPADEGSSEGEEKKKESETKTKSEEPKATGRVVYSSKTDASPYAAGGVVGLAVSLGGYALFKRLKKDGLSNFYKRRRIAQTHGRKGGTARKGLDKGERDVRSRRKSKKARRRLAKKLYGEYQDRRPSKNSGRVHRAS